MNAQNKDGLTPLFLAMNNGYVDLVEKIMRCQELDGEKQDKKDRTALYIAIEADQIEALKKIVEIIPRALGNTRKKRRLLCHAAEKSDGVKVFRWLLSKVTEDDIQFMNEDKKNFMKKLEEKEKGSNPSLQQQTSKESNPRLKQQTSKDLKTVKDAFSFEKLLESREENPMHSIAKSQITRSCEKYDLLIEVLNAENPKPDLDPLNEEEETLVVRFLNNQNKDKQTPLHIAAEDPNIQMKNENSTQGMLVSVKNVRIYLVKRQQREREGENKIEK